MTVEWGIYAVLVDLLSNLLPILAIYFPLGWVSRPKTKPVDFYLGLKYYNLGALNFLLAVKKN